MTITYEFEADYQGSDLERGEHFYKVETFNFTPDFKEVAKVIAKSFVKYEYSDYDNRNDWRVTGIADFLMDINADLFDKISEDYESEIKEYFEPFAREAWANSGVKNGFN